MLGLRRTAPWPDRPSLHRHVHVHPVSIMRIGVKLCREPLPACSNYLGTALTRTIHATSFVPLANWVLFLAQTGGPRRVFQVRWNLEKWTQRLKDPLHATNARGPPTNKPRHVRVNREQQVAAVEATGRDHHTRPLDVCTKYLPSTDEVPRLLIPGTWNTPPQPPSHPDWHRQFVILSLSNYEVAPPLYRPD